MTASDSSSEAVTPPNKRPHRGVREFLAIAGAGVGVQVLTIASGPLVARMLGPQGRGEMVTVFVIMAMCSLLTVGGFPAAISRTVAASGAPARDVLRGHRRLWAAVSVAPAAASGALTLLLVRDSPAMLELTIAACTITVLTTWVLLVAAMLQGEGHVRRVNAFRLFGVAVYVGIVIVVFVVHPTDDVGIVLLMFSVAQAAGLLLGWTMLNRPTGDRNKRVSDSELHGFARRGFISGVSILDGWGIDHLLVGAVLGQAALGLYATAFSVSNVPSMVLGGVAALLLPRMVAAAPQQSIRLLRRWVLGAIALDILMVGGLQLLVDPVIRFAFGEAFVPSITTARICIVFAALFALRRVLTAAAQAQGKAGRASMIEGVCAVVMILGALVGMAYFGIEGAALGMSAAGALSCICLASILSWRTPKDMSPEDPTAVQTQSGGAPSSRSGAAGPS